MGHGVPGDSPNGRLHPARELKEKSVRQSPRMTSQSRSPPRMLAFTFPRPLSVHGYGVKGLEAEPRCHWVVVRCIRLDMHLHANTGRSSSILGHQTICC